ncbi:hypothetical protein L1887_02518 [Cichorium endivia]|nr:hypothetical protein L1887_02518 [Cichorium endivia]
MISEQKNIPKLPLGKGGSGLGNRKALNDITNKPNIHQETSTKKKNSQKEEFNISEERFLHDHNKCIKAQQTITESMFWDIVLPGHDSLPLEAPVSSPSKIDHYTPSFYPEPVELDMWEFRDWLESGPQPESPDSSFLHLESPRDWEYEEVEFFLKPESDC